LGWAAAAAAVSVKARKLKSRYNARPKMRYAEANQPPEIE